MIPEACHEGDLEIEHRHAERDEHHRRQDLAGDLGRGGDLTDVVDQPDEIDEDGAEDHPERLGVVEDLREAPHARGDEHRDEKGEEHRPAPGDRRRGGVHAVLAGVVDRAESRGERPHREGEDERRDRGDREDDDVVAGEHLRGPENPPRGGARRAGSGPTGATRPRGTDRSCRTAPVPRRAPRAGWPRSRGREAPVPSAARSRPSHRDPSPPSFRPVSRGAGRS